MRRVVAALATLAACSTADPAKVEAASNDVLEVRTFAEQYRIDKGVCPRAQDLAARELIKSAADPWGIRYEIVCGERIWVRSSGPDRKSGTADDVYSDGTTLEETAKALVLALAHEATHGELQHACPANIDPWGKTTMGVCARRGAMIKSAGPDGEFDTADDIKAEVDAP